MTKKALQKGTENMGKFATAKQAFIGGGYKTAIGAGSVDALSAAGTVAAQEQTRVTTDEDKDEIDRLMKNINKDFDVTSADGLLEILEPVHVVPSEI